MKKIMAMMIGLGLMLGTVSLFAQDAPKQDQKQDQKKKKGSKKKKGEKKDEAKPTR